MIIKIENIPKNITFKTLTIDIDLNVEIPQVNVSVPELHSQTVSVQSPENVVNNVQKIGEVDTTGRIPSVPDEMKLSF